MSDAPAHKEIVGVCEGYDEKPGSDWVTFKVKTDGSQYPVKLSTKKHELVTAGKNVGTQRAVWGFLESQGAPNPHKPGTHYMNRWLDSVTLVAERGTIEADLGDISEQSAAPHPAETEQAPAEVVDWDAKERRIVRQACLKAAVAFGATTLDVALRNAEAFEQWVYRKVEYQPAEALVAEAEAASQGSVPVDDITF